MILVLFSMSRWKRFDLCVCVCVYALNLELGSISASVGNETRGVTMWKKTNEIGRNRKQGVGGEKRRKWKGKKKGKKQKWKLTPFPLFSPPPSAKEESLFPRVSSSVEEKERKKKKKEECFYETKWQLFLLSKMDYLVRKT